MVSLPHCGIVVRSLDLRLKMSWVQISAVTAVGKLFTQCASVTKQYNLVPVNGRWCPAAGKATVGLATHWPCITDQWFIHLLAHGLRKGDEHPAYTPHGTLLAFLLPCCDFFGQSLVSLNRLLAVVEYQF